MLESSHIPFPKKTPASAPFHKITIIHTITHCEGPSCGWGSLEHWENEHDEIADSLDLAAVAPGESRENIAVFARTRGAGRPKAADLEKEKQGRTLYILLKTTDDGKESCKAIGEIDIDAEGNAKETRKARCSPEQITTPKSSKHARSKSTPNSKSRKRGLDEMNIGEISYEMTGKDAEHECGCGPTCECSFCPLHPNTEATKDVMRQLVGQVQNEARSNAQETGELSVPQHLGTEPSCSGGQFTPANTQLLYTYNPHQFNDWREQSAEIPHFMASVTPLQNQLASSSNMERTSSTPNSAKTPQDVAFPIHDVTHRLPDNHLPFNNLYGNGYVSTDLSTFVPGQDQSQQGSGNSFNDDIDEFISRQNLTTTSNQPVAISEPDVLVPLHSVIALMQSYNASMPPSTVNNMVPQIPPQPSYRGGEFNTNWIEPQDFGEEEHVPQFQVQPQMEPHPSIPSATMAPETQHSFYPPQNVARMEPPEGQGNMVNRQFHPYVIPNHEWPAYTITWN
ncbi:hypothetical protein UCRPC4_g03418 [Phaeomoniella chlamydospora]|uniref:Copper-fist domain-containing protein n=1 Tax=Phaeomoniella chlamydospora TaxID=158046 RepID=A0A0G2GZ94_PHACM|nr:hypothetical protein UCRPC4_g03418 [Phaeomoniella chlamydospora]